MAFPRLEDITPEMYDQLNAEIERTFEEGCHGDCGSCASGCESNPNVLPKFAKRLFAVTGGKGGTGKSTLTVLLAHALTRRGLKVGILDADISGSSIPQLLGVTGPVVSQEDKMKPVVTKEGMEVMAFNLIAQDLTEPVIWPGADTANVVSYLYTGTAWSELDVLLMDMPAGAGDVPLNIYTTLPVDGVVLVAEPGTVGVPAVARCAALCAMLMSPPVAFVENKALSAVPVSADRYDLPVGCMKLAVPLSADIAAACDEGELGKVAAPELEPLAAMMVAAVKN